MRHVTLAPAALDDCEYWSKNNFKICRKILGMLDEIAHTPFTGTGGPEPLKHSGPNKWSRELDEKNRLTYTVYDDRIEVSRCRGHYDD